MKRIFIIVLVISLLVVPVAADSWYTDYQQSVFNVLEYDYPNDQTSHTIRVNNGGTVTYDFEGTYPFSYFDMIISYSGYDISSISLNGSALTLIPLGNRLYRVYGQFTRKSYSQFDLVFNTTGYVDVTFLQFEAYPNFSTPQGLTGQFTWERFTSEMEQGTREQTSFRESVFINKPAFTNTIYDSSTIPWKVYLTADDWNKYDYLTFLCSSDMSIDSIVVNSDLGQLPFTVSDFLVGNDESNINSKLFSVTVDISGYPRNSSQDPTLSIMLSQDAAIPGSFYLYEVTGSLKYDYLEPSTYWLRRLFIYSNNWWSALYDFLGDIGGYVQTGFADLTTFLTKELGDIELGVNNIRVALSAKFDSLQEFLTSQLADIELAVNNVRVALSAKLDNLISVLKSDSTENKDSAEDFNNSVETQADELQDMSDVMNSVDRPEIDDIDVDFSKYVSQSDISGLTAPLEALFSGDIFGVVLILSVMMGTVSFVFYGKR